MWDHEPLVEEIARIADGSFKDRNPPEIRGTGYVVRSLEAALWAFHRSDTFREGALLAANLGDDADTTAPSTARSPARTTGPRQSRPRGESS